MKPLYFNVYNVGIRRDMKAAKVLLCTLLLASATARAETVLVFAAASTGPAIEEIAGIYRAEHGDRVRISPAASSALARQIANGAPADVFLSANNQWMDYVEARGALVTGSRVGLLTNRLVLVAPAAHPVKLAIKQGFALHAVLEGGRLAIADPDHVPAGIYARAALESLGVWSDISANLARTVNVRAAVELVSRRETPLGITYASDVRGEARLTTVALFPEDTHPPIVYPLALVDGKRVAAARKFVRFLATPGARKVFLAHGFESPSEQ